MKIVDPELRKKILEVMGDLDSPRILNAIREHPKDAQALATEVGIPLSSTYRKLGMLREVGLVMVRSFEITPEGKRQEQLISAVTEVRIKVDGEQIEVELIPTRDGANRIWFTLFKS